MPRLCRITLGLAATAIATVAYTQVMACVGSGTPPEMAAADQLAHEMLVPNGTPITIVESI